MWRLAHGSLWLQTLSCKSLLIFNKPTFPARKNWQSIYFRSTFWWPVWGSREEPMILWLVSKLVQYSPWAHFAPAFHTNSGVERFIFFLKLSIWPLSVLNSPGLDFIFWLRLGSVCEYMFGNLVWFWNQTVSLELASLWPIPSGTEAISLELCNFSLGPIHL